MIERRITVSQSYDLMGSVRALGVGRWDGHGWTWAADRGFGPATVRIERIGGEVAVSGWGEGAEEIVVDAERLLGLDDTPTIEGNDDRSKAILRDSTGIRLGATRDTHSALVVAVLGQLVTTREAKKSLRRLVRELGPRAPGPFPDLRMFPPAHQLADLGPHDLHPFGIEAKRASTLIEVSRRGSRIREILGMPRDEAQSRLLAVRGIGPWTAAHVMGVAYGDRDAVPMGDYHLPNAVSWALAGEDRGDDARMVELLEPFRPERRRMVVAIKHARVRAPRYGPRAPVRRHL